MTDDLRLIEEHRGLGALETPEASFDGIAYEIRRYQGMAASGMPIPGLLRIEGRVELGAIEDSAALVGSTLTLRLESGRALGVTLADADGRVLTEGHGPSKCGCC